MINKFGCKSIISVENNWYCYLKCLAVKDALKFNNVGIDDIDGVFKQTKK